MLCEGSPLLLYSNGPGHRNGLVSGRVPAGSRDRPRDRPRDPRRSRIEFAHIVVAQSRSLGSADRWPGWPAGPGWLAGRAGWLSRAG